MKRKTIVFGSILLMIFCCGFALVFVDGSLLPSKPCRPITYPQGKVSKGFSSVTADSLDIVSEFYVSRLDVKPWPADTGQWRREELDSGILFSCMGVDINGLTTETGCIHVSNDGQSTVIEANLFRSEGGNIPCPKK